jgi:glycosyltransferase involved in cell wall biosynthesis
VLAPSALALHERNIPFVWHVREPAAAGHTGVRAGYIGRLLRTLGREVIFICDDDRQSWVRGERGVVVYNFVDFERFHRGIGGRALRERLGIASEAKVVLYLGGLSIVKGVETLLESIDAVRKQVPNVVFLMPGAEISLPSRLRTRLAYRVRTALGRTTVQGIQSRLESLQREGVVRMLPYQTDIAPYIAASDVLVFPAIKPHFARPVLEAAALGKPAIGSQVGGVREVIESGSTGFLVPPGSASALAASIQSVLSDPELAERLGEQAYRMARERFDSSINIQQIETIYRAILPEAIAGHAQPER